MWVKILFVICITDNKSGANLCIWGLISEQRINWWMNQTLVPRHWVEFKSAHPQTIQIWEICLIGNVWILTLLNTWYRCLIHYLIYSLFVNWPPYVNVCTGLIVCNTIRFYSLYVLLCTPNIFIYIFYPIMDPKTEAKMSKNWTWIWSMCQVTHVSGDCSLWIVMNLFTLFTLWYPPLSLMTQDNAKHASTDPKLWVNVYVSFYPQALFFSCMSLLLAISFCRWPYIREASLIDDKCQSLLILCKNRSCWIQLLKFLSGTSE
jgi:hypothetical protein